MPKVTALTCAFYVLINQEIVEFLSTFDRGNEGSVDNDHAAFITVSYFTGARAG